MSVDVDVNVNESLRAAPFTSTFTFTTTFTMGHQLGLGFVNAVNIVRDSRRIGARGHGNAVNRGRASNRKPLVHTPGDVAAPGVTRVTHDSPRIADNISE